MKKQWNVGWGFTKLCNLNCKHCYNASGKRDPDELSLKDAIKVVDKLAENGVKTINYGTGECGLVDEFWDLIEYVHSKGLEQGLTTNGSSVTKNSIEKLKKNMNDIDVSIDFVDKDDHNAFRNNPKSWNWAINALDLLKETKIPFSIVTCLHSKNSSFESIKKFLNLSKMYICNWRVNWFRPTGRGKENADMKLDPIYVHEIFKFLMQNAIIKALPDPYFASLIGLKKNKGCPCGENSFRITPSSKVVPCVYFTKEMDNISIKNSSFDQIIKSKPFENMKTRKIEYCKDCEYDNSCHGGCASRAYLENKNLNSSDAFCFRQAGLKENPLKGIEFEYKPEEMLVHDNYLCTVIFKSKS